MSAWGCSSGEIEPPPLEIPAEPPMDRAEIEQFLRKEVAREDREKPSIFALCTWPRLSSDDARRLAGVLGTTKRRDDAIGLDSRGTVILVMTGVIDGSCESIRKRLIREAEELFPGRNAACLVRNPKDGREWDAERFVEGMVKKVIDGTLV